MNQSMEIHFKVLHPHNKLVQTITMGTQVVKARVLAQVKNDN